MINKKKIIRKIKVTVTQNHIDAAAFMADNKRRLEKKDLWAGETCPIALTLCEAGLSEPSVNSRKIMDIDLDVGYDKYFHHSRASKRFVKNFDAGKKVKPFKFILTQTRW